jgi:hypothetical protein
MRMFGSKREQCLPENHQRANGLELPTLINLYCVSIWFLFLACAVPASVAQSASESAITLTAEERTWLKAHPDITLAWQYLIGSVLFFMGGVFNYRRAYVVMRQAIAGRP